MASTGMVNSEARGARRIEGEPWGPAREISSADR
jgi:hypothetical protein